MFKFDVRVNKQLLANLDTIAYFYLNLLQSIIDFY